MKGTRTTSLPCECNLPIRIRHNAKQRNYVLFINGSRRCESGRYKQGDVSCHHSFH